MLNQTQRQTPQVNRVIPTQQFWSSSSRIHSFQQNFNLSFLKEQLLYEAQKDITWLRKKRWNRLLVLIIGIVTSNIVIMTLIGFNVINYIWNTTVIAFVTESVLQLFWLCLVVVKFLFHEKSMK